MIDLISDILKKILAIIFILFLFQLYIILDNYKYSEEFALYIKGQPKSSKYSPFGYTEMSEFILDTEKHDDSFKDNFDSNTNIYEVTFAKINNPAYKELFNLESIKEDMMYFNNASNLKFSHKKNQD